ncbi:hypothetical protein KXV85_002499, partial [Aspergillus fumigatus]
RRGPIRLPIDIGNDKIGHDKAVLRAATGYRSVGRSPPSQFGYQRFSDEAASARDHLPGSWPKIPAGVGNLR